MFFSFLLVKWAILISYDMCTTFSLLSLNSGENTFLYLSPFYTTIRKLHFSNSVIKGFFIARHTVVHNNPKFPSEILAYGLHWSKRTLLLWYKTSERDEIRSSPAML